MLTPEVLFTEAEARGLPRTKARGIVREYAHYLILHSINTHTDRLILTGGTALRLLHNFGRLSFDLDFDASGFTAAILAGLLTRLTSDLARSGIEARASQPRERRAIISAEVKMPGVLDAFGAGAGREQLMVKVEVLNVSKGRLKVQPSLAHNFDGQAILVNALEISYLAAEKCAAFFERGRERDYYDVFFLLAGQKPIDLKLLNAIQKLRRFENPEDLHAAIRSKFERTDMAAVARKLEPFLIDPAHARILKEGAARV